MDTNPSPAVRNTIAAPDVVYATRTAEYRAQQKFLADLGDACRRMRLARSQWMRILGCQNDSELIERAPEVAARANAAERLWHDYVAQLHQQVEYEASRPALIVDGQPRLSTVQVARALGASDFHVANLRRRGRLPAETINPRTSAFEARDVHAFIESPFAFATGASPLTSGFYRFLIERDPRFSDLREYEVYHSTPDGGYTLVRTRLGLPATPAADPTSPPVRSPEPVAV